MKCGGKSELEQLTGVKEGGKMRRSAAPSSVSSTTAKRPRFQTPFSHSLGAKKEVLRRENENMSLNSVSVSQPQHAVSGSLKEETSRSRLQEVLSRIRKIPADQEVHNVSFSYSTIVMTFCS